MKKTLYELFDQATPDELELLSSELEGNLLPQKVLSSVKSKVYAKTEFAHCNNEKGRIIMKEKKFTRLYKTLLASAACLALVAGCFAGYAALSRGQQQSLPSKSDASSDSSDCPTELQTIATTTVTLDVNPSLEIKANGEETVLGVTALNEDAEIVVGDMEFEGSSLELTVNALIGSMLQKGYINKETNTVLVSIDSKDEKTGNTIKEKLSKEISLLVNTEEINGSVISQTVSAQDEELLALASEHGISVGKAKLIQTIVQMDTERVFSDFVGMTITQLNMVMNASVENPAPENTYIGEEKALEIAFDGVNLTIEDLSANPIVELVSRRGEICYQIRMQREWVDESGKHSDSFVVYVNAFTGKVPGEGVEEPNFTMEEAWEVVSDQLGSDAEKAEVLSWTFHGMDTALPMTYTFHYKVERAEYCVLVDAMSGEIIRTVSM